MADAFPDPRTYEFPEWVPVGDFYYHGSDVVDFGTPLTAETVAEAYTKGIFPWHMRDVPLPWFCPEYRAVLFFDELHIPHSLKKKQRKEEFTFTIDRDFSTVIAACARSPRNGQKGTWITQDFVDVYELLHKKGMVHSVEAWDGEGNLAGGLYGVDGGGVFCGESMFYRKPDASKLALLFLIDHLKERGSTFLDAQVMTPHIEALGAREISRNEFLDEIGRAQKRKIQLFG